MKKGRKDSGGRYKKGAKKRKKYEIRKQPRIVKLGEIKRRKVKTMGGKSKLVLISCNVANIINKKTKKTSKAKIKTVIETPSNIFLARQNILMKGAIIDTDIGKAKITNRPSQEPHIEAVLIEEKTEEKE